MDLSEKLREECVETGAEAVDKQAALGIIARIAKKSDVLSAVSEETVLGALKDREAMGSTGFGHGIAIPHCALDNISDFVVGVMTVPDGVEFETLDGEKARLFMFIIGPTAERNKHISVLATISRVLRIEGAVEELLAEKSPVAVRESFLRYSQGEVDTAPDTESCLFHVFVQEEDKFNDILEVFTAIDSCSVSVSDARDASSFLYTMPLFASFWHEEPHGFNRVITAIVKKPLANDTIRQINEIAGGLDKHPGIAVTVEDVFFFAGSLHS